MSDGLQIILTAAATLVGGAFLLMFGEFMNVLVISPLKKYKDNVQYIFDRTEYHANYITNYFPKNPSKEEKEYKVMIIKEFRSAATQLNSTYANISLRKYLVKVGIVPAISDIQEIYKNLVFISNNMPTEGRDGNNEVNPIDQNYKAMQKIKQLLK